MLGRTYPWFPSCHKELTCTMGLLVSLPGYSMAQGKRLQELCFGSSWLCQNVKGKIPIMSNRIYLSKEQNKTWFENHTAARQNQSWFWELQPTTWSDNIYRKMEVRRREQLNWLLLSPSASQLVTGWIVRWTQGLLQTTKAQLLWIKTILPWSVGHSAGAQPNPWPPTNFI